MDFVPDLVAIVCFSVFTVLFLAIAVFYVSQRCWRYGLFCGIFGATVLSMQIFSAYDLGQGRAARVKNLREEAVYCVAAKVDDTYIVRNVQENKNYFLYSPQQPLPACFVTNK